MGNPYICTCGYISAPVIDCRACLRKMYKARVCSYM